MAIKPLSVLMCTVVLTFSGTLPALAESDRQQLAERFKVMESRMKAMQAEMDVLKTQLQNAPDMKLSKELEAKVEEAAEWRQPDTLIHMAGYADVGYTDSESEDGSFYGAKFSPIFHFQYRDQVMLESELEIEVTEDGETETKLEYLSIDWFINDYMVLVAGKFLSPIGQFRQNLHPAWINKLASAPPGFGHDGAAPVSDVGLQLRGGFPLGKTKANYAVFVSNGPELKTEFEDGEYELDGVEAEGFGSDSDGEKVVGGRLGLLPFPELEIGFSIANGKATVTSVEDGDSSLLSGERARDYDVIGADFSWQFNNLSWRGEYVETEVGDDNGGGTAASVGGTWETWYTQAAFRIPKSRWELVARYSDFDSPHNSRDQQQWAVGANYLFANNFIGKLSYEFNDGLSGSDADLDRLLLQMAYGF